MVARRCRLRAELCRLAAVRAAAARRRRLGCTCWRGGSFQGTPLCSPQSGPRSAIPLPIRSSLEYCHTVILFCCHILVLISFAACPRFRLALHCLLCAMDCSINNDYGLALFRRGIYGRDDKQEGGHHKTCRRGQTAQAERSLLGQVHGGGRGRRGYWVAMRARSRTPAVLPMYMSRVMRELAWPAMRETSVASSSR